MENLNVDVNVGVFVKFSMGDWYAFRVYILDLTFFFWLNDCCFTLAVNKFAVLSLGA